LLRLRLKGIAISPILGRLGLVVSMVGDCVVGDDDIVAGLVGWLDSRVAFVVIPSAEHSSWLAFVGPFATESSVRRSV
jgi:hypothetical protein